MLKILKLLPFIFFICILNISCGKNINCIEANFVISYVSFPDAETDSIVIRKYGKGDNFTTLIDSILITRQNSLYTTSGDTLSIHTSQGGDYTFTSGFDYQVYLPTSGRVIRITDIVEIPSSHHVGISMDKTVCVNPIQSYKVDGQLVSGKGNYFFFYINK